MCSIRKFSLPIAQWEVHKVPNTRYCKNERCYSKILNSILEKPPIAMVLTGSGK